MFDVPRTRNFFSRGWSGDVIKNLSFFYYRSPFFHDFIKQCLTKNPKKRPTPEKLLEVFMKLMNSHDNIVILLEL